MPMLLSLKNKGPFGGLHSGRIVIALAILAIASSV